MRLSTSPTRSLCSLPPRPVWSVSLCFGSSVAQMTRSSRNRIAPSRPHGSAECGTVKSTYPFLRSGTVLSVTVATPKGSPSPVSFLCQAGTRRDPRSPRWDREFLVDRRVLDVARKELLEQLHAEAELLIAGLGAEAG